LDNIITEISKPVWWISVVIAGIVINLLAAYIKSSLDKLLPKTFSYWRNISVKRKASWLKRIDEIRHNEEIKKKVLTSEIRLTLRSINMLLLGIFILLVPIFAMVAGHELSKIDKIAVLALASLMFFVSMVYGFGAISATTALQEAQKSNSQDK